MGSADCLPRSNRWSGHSTELGRLQPPEEWAADPRGRCFICAVTGAQHPDGTRRYRRSAEPYPFRAGLGGLDAGRPTSRRRAYRGFERRSCQFAAPLLRRAEYIAPGDRERDAGAGHAAAVRGCRLVDAIGALAHLLRVVEPDVLWRTRLSRWFSDAGRKSKSKRSDEVTRSSPSSSCSCTTPFPRRSMAYRISSDSLKHRRQPWRRSCS